jgi:hypothetical protein
MQIFARRSFDGAFTVKDNVREKLLLEETDEAIPESAFERDRCEILKAEIW